MENKNELNTEPKMRSSDSIPQSAIPTQQSSTDATPQSALPIPQSIEILIVEDSAVEAEMLRRILVRAGYRVHAVAKNGEAGLQALREHPCTLVMSDINMPLMNGYELCHAIKLDEKLWGTPVILVTSLSEPKDIIKALDVGADGYVTKPYVEDILLGRIRSMLANKSHRKLAEERRKIQVEYGGEKHNVAVDSPQMANLLLSVYENSLTLNQELMHIQNQLNVLNESLDEKVRERTASLRASEARFRNLVEATSDWIWEVDENAVYTYVSPKCHDILGYLPEEVIGKTPFDLMPPEEAKRVASLFGPIAAAQAPLINLENINLHKSGHRVVIETSGVPIFDQDGNFCGYHGIDRDITERKQAEGMLRESEQRHRQIVQTSMDGFWITDTQGRILDVNDAYCELVGYAREELLNMRITDVEAKETPEQTAQQIQGIMTKGYARFETRHRRKDGQLLDIEVSAVHRADPEDGQLFVFLRDITERKQASILINEQVEELQRWQDVTMGREMRTIELKHEVNELLKQAGQPPRYPSAESVE